MDENLRDFVFDRFDEAHSATPCVDYPRWNRVNNENARPTAALGYRDASDGRLFLETYLDASVERIVSEIFGRDIARQAIVEIGCLAAMPSLALVRLWCDTANSLVGTHEVAVATLTRPLRRMFAKVGLPLVELARANPALVSDATSWGSYYETDPVVCAGDIGAGAAALAIYSGRGGRA